MTADPTWNFQNPAGKQRLLDTFRRESDEMFELMAEPANWRAPTACTGWEVRDMVGHLIDATESYLAAFDIARSGGAAPAAVGVAGMAKATDRAARAFRVQPRDQLLPRLRHVTDELIREMDSLSDTDWTSLQLCDRYMGALPANIVAAGALGGATVHGWDVREGLGRPHAIAGDAADLLVPFVFLLWWATADTATVGSPYSIGVRTTGHNGGDTRFEVTNKGLQFTPGNIDTCAAIMEFDPASLVLTAYGRINGGTLRGDKRLATKFRSLFAPI